MTRGLYGWARRGMAMGLALGLWGCGAEHLDLYGADGPDTERMDDPEERAEAELRMSPTFDPVFNEAAREFGVPAAVLKGLSWAQTRYEDVLGEEEFDGRPAAYGVMGLAGEDLRRGAQLAGLSEERVRTDQRANVRAAAALLQALAQEAGIDASQVTAWAPLLGRFSGVDDPEARAAFVRDEVFGALKLGVGEPSEELRAEGQSLELADEFESLGQELQSGPDYAKSVWRPSPHHSTRSTKAQMVIIHTCEGAYSGCWGWQVNPSSNVSAHYTVNSNGSEITQTVRESRKAWHIGATYSCNNNAKTKCNLNGVQSNNFTVGIEHAGFASQKSWSSGLINASARLTCDITKGHGIPRNRQHIVGHGQLQPYNRTDPGKNWPWSTYMSQINSACGASTPAPNPNPTPTPNPSPGSALVIDSNNANNNKAKGYIQVSANWTGTASTKGYYGSGYYFAGTKPVSDGATFWFYLPAAATKTVDAWWTAGANRSTEAPYVAFNAQGQKVGTGTANQTRNGGKWNAVGSFKFTAGWNKVVLSRWAPAGKVVIGDAVRIR